MWPVFPVSMTEVPLTDHCRLVASFLESLWERGFLGWQAIGVSRENHKCLQAGSHRVATSHQGCESWCAKRHSVK